MLGLRRNVWREYSFIPRFLQTHIRRSNISAVQDETTCIMASFQDSIYEGLGEDTYIVQFVHVVQFVSDERQFVVSFIFQ